MYSEDKHTVVDINLTSLVFVFEVIDNFARI